MWLLKSVIREEKLAVSTRSEGEEKLLFDVLYSSNEWVYELFLIFLHFIRYYMYKTQPNLSIHTEDWFSVDQPTFIKENIREYDILTPFIVQWYTVWQFVLI